MDVALYPRPCLLYEAAELVFALVNGIPPEKLTGTGEYCIPPDHVQAIQAEACAGLSLEDEQLQFYFRGVPLEGTYGRTSCLGCCLLYSSLEIASSGVEEMQQALSAAWADHRERGYRINGIDAFSIGMEPTEDRAQFTSLSKEIAWLPVPQAYQMQLLEVFSAFDQHLAQVTSILKPVAAKLESLLEPWVARAQDLLQGWETLFRQENQAEEFMLHQAQLRFDHYNFLGIALRYFSFGGSPGKIDELTGRVSFHMSVSVPPSLEQAEPLPAMMEQEYSALRLLANSDRVEMLRLMAERPMSGSEVARQLQSSVGSTFRDINNMYNAGLLLLLPGKGKSLYSTNFPAIETLTTHLLEYLRSGEKGHS